MIFKTESGSSELNGFLDRGSSIDGELKFQSSFRVDGKVHGKVRSDGDLVIGEGGEVEGEVRVARVFVNGTLKGNAYTERLQIAAGGRVLADIETPSLVIEDGAVFEGSCSMVRQDSKPEEVSKVAPMPVRKN